LQTICKQTGFKKRFIAFANYAGKVKELLCYKGKYLPKEFGKKLINKSLNRKSARLIDL
jgi:hypothetical protein